MYAQAVKWKSLKMFETKHSFQSASGMPLDDSGPVYAGPQGGQGAAPGPMPPGYTGPAPGYPNSDVSCEKDANKYREILSMATAA